MKSLFLTPFLIGTICCFEMFNSGFSFGSTQNKTPNTPALDLFVVISQEALALLFEKDQNSTEGINEIQLGTPVVGTAQTQSHSQIQLFPNSDVAQLSLNVTGNTQAWTNAFADRATIATYSNTGFFTQKTIWWDRNGLRASAAETSAQTANSVTGVNVDPSIPFPGIAERIAYDRASEMLPQAAELTSRAVSDRANQEVDTAFSNELKAFHGGVIDGFLPKSIVPFISSDNLRFATTDSYMSIAGFQNPNGVTVAQNTAPVFSGHPIVGVDLHQRLVSKAVMDWLSKTYQLTTLPASELRFENGLTTVFLEVNKIPVLGILKGTYDITLQYHLSMEPQGFAIKQAQVPVVTTAHGSVVNPDEFQLVNEYAQTLFPEALSLSLPGLAKNGLFSKLRVNSLTTENEWFQLSFLLN